MKNNNPVLIRNLTAYFKCVLNVKKQHILPLFWPMSV